MTRTTTPSTMARSHLSFQKRPLHNSFAEARTEHSEAPIQGGGRMEDNMLFKCAQQHRTRDRRPREAARATEQLLSLSLERQGSRLCVQPLRALILRTGNSSLRTCWERSDPCTAWTVATVPTTRVPSSPQHGHHRLASGDTNVRKN